MTSAKGYAFIKRTADVLLSVVLLVILLPLFLFLALIVAAETEQFPFFVQERGITLDHRVFRIIKFRTMKNVSSSVPLHRSADVFKKYFYADAVPPFCTWLRRTGLDELPQLWNILKGEMSFVGPRPLSTVDLAVMRDETPALYGLRTTLQCKAGLTGGWQLFGDRDAGTENLLALDIEYDRSRSLAVDGALLAKTIPVVFLAAHSDAIVGSGRKSFSVPTLAKMNAAR